MGRASKTRETLSLSGIVGILGAEELLSDARLLLKADADVHVDGEAVEHMDCAAAQILLALGRALDESGRHLTVRLSPSAESYLRRAGLGDLLDLEPSTQSTSES